MAKTGIFWISKYALTQGVFSIKADISDTSDGMLVDRSGGYASYYHGEGREWHRTKEGACAKAEEMRISKLRSIEKQEKRLRDLVFVV